MLVGNDISAFQGDINWDTYKNNSNFVIIKATEGVGFTDGKFIHNQSEARRLDLSRGYYHFARPDLGNTPLQEAEWFLKTVGKLYEGEILALDYEVNWYGDVVVWCRDFLNEVYKRTGCKPLIYLNQYLIQKYAWEPIVQDGYALWVAAYTYDPMKNTFQIGSWLNGAAMQQWTDKQQVPGILAPTDGDCFFGSVEDFKKYGFHAPTPSVEGQSPRPPVDDPCHDYKDQLHSLQRDFDAYKASHPDTQTDVLNDVATNPIKHIDIVRNAISNILDVFSHKP